jgi:hypothetical protein
MVALVVKSSIHISAVGVGAANDFDDQSHQRRVLVTEVTVLLSFKAAVLIDHLLDVLHGIMAWGSALGFKAGGQGLPGLDIEVAFRDGGEVGFAPGISLGAEQRLEAAVVFRVIGRQFELVADGFGDDKFLGGHGMRYGVGFRVAGRARIPGRRGRL